MKTVFDLRIHKKGELNEFIYSQLEQIGAGCSNLKLLHLPSIIAFQAMMEHIKINVKFAPPVLEIYEDGQLLVTITEKQIIGQVEADLIVQEQLS